MRAALVPIPLSRPASCPTGCEGMSSEMVGAPYHRLARSWVPRASGSFLVRQCQGDRIVNPWVSESVFAGLGPHFHTIGEWGAGLGAEAA